MVQLSSSMVLQQHMRTRKTMEVCCPFLFLFHLFIPVLSRAHRAVRFVVCVLFIYLLVLLSPFTRHEVKVWTTIDLPATFFRDVLSRVVYIVF
jgi:hypothetical protein